MNNLKLRLYLIVFFSGGAVLALEILGTRILAPFYGSSIFLWSALISITLLALSIGYILGGRLADRKAEPKILMAIIAAAAVWILIIPFIRDIILGISENAGLRQAVLISSFILFAPPLTLLGMVSPYAIKLKVTGINDVGRSAGDLYAVSTIGSIIFALLTGFLLIPIAGVNTLTFSIGIILLMVSLLGWVNKKSGRQKISTVVLFIILAGVGIFLAPYVSSDKPDQVLYSTQSVYGKIDVVDTEGNRFLLIDGGVHSSVDGETMENNHPYVWALDMMKNLSFAAGDLLLIGLGGGSVVKSYYKDNWDVEAVEIDPAVTETAYRFFGLDPNWGMIFHIDGRKYLQTTEKKYNLIIFDAFGSSSIPFHLITFEAFQLAKSRLYAKGILAVNVEAVGWDDVIVNSVYATLKKCFNNVLVFPIAEPPDQLGNVIIAASDNELELHESLERNYTDPGYRFSSNYVKVHAWDNAFSPGEDAQVITDDLNPVDVWSERINYEARKQLHKYFGEKGIMW